MNFKQLQERAYAIAESKGWWSWERNDGELIALMHSELSEALEGMRAGDISNVAEELADTVIRIMDFCQARNINLEEAIIKKMDYNETREYKHGGKAF